MPHGFALGAERSHQVQVRPGLTQIQLPNGFAYDAGAVVALTDHEFDQIDPSAFGVLVDDITVTYSPHRRIVRTSHAS